MEIERTTQNSGRNLVLCFDGTADWAGCDSTNALKIFEKLSRDNQVLYYDGGVGTLNDPSQLTVTGRMVMRGLDLGLATSLREKVLGGYNFLVQNYRAGDNIYFFGFSRGSYTARVLAGFIHNFGLLRLDHQNLAPYLWQTFSDFKMKKQFDTAVETIRRDFSRLEGTEMDAEGIPRIKIHFLGLFDTVSSVGILKRFKTFPNTAEIPCVRHVRHAISIDERRNCFPENLFSVHTPGLVEVWFPGVHRDVGGGYDLTESGYCDNALNWIAGEATNLNLKFDESPRRDGGGKKLHLSGFDVYVFAGIYPMKSWGHFVRGYRVLWPNAKHQRNIPQNALIHPSVAELQKGSYSPPNLPDQPVYYDPAQPSEAQQPPHYQFKMPKWNVPDLVGTVLGTGLSLEFGLGMVKGWLEPKWPVWWAYGAILAYILILAMGDKMAIQMPKALKHRGLVGAVMIAALVGVVYLLRGCPIFLAGSALGFVVWSVSQVPPLPALRADRVMPLFGMYAMGLGLAFWLLQKWTALAGLLNDGWAMFEYHFHVPMHLRATVFLSFAYAAFAVVVIWNLIEVIKDRRLMASVLEDRKKNF